MRYLKFALLLCFCSAPALADTVLLKNGDRLTGTVDSISGGHVLLKTDYAGHVPIDLSAVVELVTEEAFDVFGADGSVNGRFAMQEGSQVLVSDTGPAPVELAGVKTAGQSNLGLTKLTRSWESRADLAATFSNGNTDTEQYSTLVESVLKQDRVQHRLSFNLSKEKAEEETTKDTLDLDYLYKRFLNEKWYASGNAKYFEDPLKGVDSRITVGAGLGYQFWDDSFGSLSTDVGVSYVQEELDGEDETNPALRWGLEYRRYLLAKKLEAFHKQSVLFIPDSDRGEVIETSTGVRYALNSRIDAVARVDMNHETKPTPGNSKTDVTYNVGVGVKF